jgi:hypothetical protein
LEFEEDGVELGEGHGDVAEFADGGHHEGVAELDAF